MDLTAAEAAEIRFRGTRYAYDRHEVDAFRGRVVATLQEYEAALAEATAKLATLERAHVRGPARRRSVGPTPRSVPTESDVSDEFTSWRTRLLADEEVRRMIGMAAEESRMLRAIARERAAEEIEHLTASARAEALEITQRAARLASQTEEAAHQRAGRILEASGDDDGHDIDALNDRIVHLRASIAAVQDRLEALAPITDEDAGGEVIELDLRDDADDVEAPKLEAAAARRSSSTTSERTAKAATSRKKRAAKKTATKTPVVKNGAGKKATGSKASAPKTAEPPSTDEISAKMAELAARLEAD